MSAQDPEVVLVRMSHPATGGEIRAQPGQVEHLKASGWKVDDPDADYDRWPEELQRFGGEEAVLIRHPITGGEAVVPRSAVPTHRSSGWVEVTPETEAEQLEAKTVEELKELARTRDLPVSGTKAELVERLSEYDRGSDLPTGATTVVNDTGEPEQVVPASQESEE